MATFKIPLVNTPQKFSITLANKFYNVTCKWNDSIDAGWVLDFEDANSGTSIVANVPLITGLNNLAGLNYLGFDGELFAYTDGRPFDAPTYVNLGIESNIYFVTSAPNG